MSEADSLTHLIPRDSFSIYINFLNMDKYYKKKRLVKIANCSKDLRSAKTSILLELFYSVL
jgi:hypothetical protein